MFQWGIRGIIVDNQTFYKYLKKGVYEFCLRYPEQQTEAQRLLLEIKIKYGCEDYCSENRILKLLKFDF